LYYHLGNNHHKEKIDTGLCCLQGAQVALGELKHQRTYLNLYRKFHRNGVHISRVGSMIQALDCRSLLMQYDPVNPEALLQWAISMNRKKPKHKDLHFRR